MKRVSLVVALAAVSAALPGCPDPSPGSDEGVDSGIYIPPTTDAGQDAGTQDDGGTNGDGGMSGLDVTGTRELLYHTTTGTTAVMADLTGATIAAHVLSGADFTTLPGTGTSEGTFTIPNVPMGEYFLQFNRIFIHTSARQVDLGEMRLGRPDAKFASYETYLTLDLSNLTPWNESDDLMFFSANAGLDYWDTYYYLPGVSGGPLQGDTNTNNWTLDYGGPRNLVEGDTLYVLQLATQVSDGGVLQVGADRVVSGPLTMQDMADTTFSGTMTPLPQTSLSVSFRADDFGAMTAAYPPGTTATGSGLYVDALPFAEDMSSGAPDLARFHVPVGSPAMDVTLKFGNPFPSSFVTRLAGTAVYATEQEMPLPDGGTVGRTSYVGMTTTVASSATNGTVAPTLGPVSQVTVNGQSITQYRSGVGTTPTVSFQAPSLGTATHYRIIPYEVAPNASGTSLGLVRSTGLMYTQSTTVKLPPGLLQAGRHYFLQISARYEEGVEVSKTPYRVGLPSANTDMVTGVFSP